MPVPSENRALPAESHEQRRTVHSTCYMCACRCGIEVTLDGAELRFIQGNRNHPVNQGVLCAKGSAGIMKQLSPAKLAKPLRRRPGSERGEGLFDEIEWDEALDLLTTRLRHIRATDPRKLAFFTGRDQMQALTGLWAQQFGTPNWAAHGGFCSVNMAAAGLYTIGYSFWEFGAPDWDRAKYFLLWGVAEDHSSNPIKIGLDKLKRHGAKFVSVNPVRTGYSAIADEWIPIRPGTDGLLALAIVHVLLADGSIDFAFLARYTNAPWLVIRAPGTAEDGLFARDDEGRPLVYDEATGTLTGAVTFDTQPALFGSRTITKGRTPGARRRSLSSPPSAISTRSTRPRRSRSVRRPRRNDPAPRTRDGPRRVPGSITLPVQWTDAWGREHDSVTGRPVAMYAMRGISAHCNGFHTCRALHFIQMLLGALEGPGNFRARAPFPKPIPPRQLPANEPPHPNTPLRGAPLGFPTRPEDLAIDADGRPIRIDQAYSWEAPLAAHGLMHMVIANAVAGDPYPIDTLMLFMANMALELVDEHLGTRDMLRAKDERRRVQDPASWSSPTRSLARPCRSPTSCCPTPPTSSATTAISLLDRPISEPDAPADAIRHPVVEPDRDVRAVAGRAGRPRRPARASRRSRSTTAGRSSRRLPRLHRPLRARAGHRVPRRLARRGRQRAARRRAQSRAVGGLHRRTGVLRPPPARGHRWYRFANRGYLEFAEQAGFIGRDEPIMLQL